VDPYEFMGITREFYEHMLTCEAGCERDYDWGFVECDAWQIKTGKTTQAEVDERKRIDRENRAQAKKTRERMDANHAAWRAFKAGTGPMPDEPWITLAWTTSSFSDMPPIDVPTITEGI